MGLSLNDGIEHVFREEKAQKDGVTIGQRKPYLTNKTEPVFPTQFQTALSYGDLGTAMGKCKYNHRTERGK